MASSSESLKEFDFQSEYDSYEDSLISDFYIPALDRSILYQRAVGYFSSAILAVLAETFTNFTLRGGKIELICSPILSAKDASILEEIGSGEIVNSLNRTLDVLDADGLIDVQLDLLSQLIKSGSLQIKFAIPYKNRAVLFHQKIGIFSDLQGNKLSFKGSNNESVSGWADFHNSENLDVFRTWKDQNERSRVERNQSRFDRMWGDSYEGFDIVDFSSALNFIERRKNDEIDLEHYRSRAKEWIERRIKNQRPESGIKLYPYQEEVLKNWADNSYRGIVSFATGAGKTITALSALEKWRSLSEKHVAVILVPSIKLQKQWLVEIRKIPTLRHLDITLAGGDVDREVWLNSLIADTRHERHPSNGVVLAVNDTARQTAFLSRIQWGRHVLLIADEMHRLGASSFQAITSLKELGAVLGLSATPIRYDDSETALLASFFGQELKPIIDIPAAQDLGVLVPYVYRFETTHLTNSEEQKYRDFSTKIGAAANDETLKERLTVLLARRSKILKSATNKTEAAAQILIKNYKQGDYWLVFCDDIHQLDSIRERISHLNPLVVHSGMSGSPEETVTLFERFGGILLSVHMFDEGIDIPKIDHALIVASSQSKREFIQRRGRVLRSNRSGIKSYSEIWDIIIVDSNEYAFRDSEITRALEFASMALNKSVLVDLKKLVQTEGEIKND